MKTDSQLKADVTTELAWDPAINPVGIGVMVKNGVVSLSGHLDTFAEKRAAERAVRRVSGVRGIAIELEVKLSAEHKRTDSDIAQAASSALRWSSLVPDERIKVEVEDGWVTLTGDVDWSYQLTSAEHCIRPLLGVRGLTNLVTIKPHISSKNIGSDITAALTRQATREGQHIGIEVEGNVVTLKGCIPWPSITPSSALRSLHAVFPAWWTNWRSAPSVPEFLIPQLLTRTIMTTHLRVLEPAFPASFESALHRLFSPTQFDLGVQPLQMRLDVSEKDNAYQVKVDLPGVKKEDINVRIDGNVVQIDAEIKQEKETKGDGGKVLRSERYYGSVSRNFSLSQDVDDSKAQARYSDGVLTLDLPKKTTSASKKVTVQ